MADEPSDTRGFQPEHIDTTGVEPEPEGAETPMIWPAVAGSVLGAFLVAIGVIVSEWWVSVLGGAIVLLGLLWAPVLARYPRDRKGRRRDA